MKTITIENISKNYGETPVLRNISAVIDEGMSVCVCGPSGSGKTTLLRILMRLETPSGGVISGIPERISPVFQEDRLCETLSALDNVRLTADISADACAALLRELGLGHALSLPATGLSGGMKRRVAIARALAHNSGLILMDEPFSGLDEETAQNAERVIRANTRGRTLIYTLHDARKAHTGDLIIDLGSDPGTGK